jgi:quinol monooxygenase YgiN
MCKINHVLNVSLFMFVERWPDAALLAWHREEKSIVA